MLKIMTCTCGNRLIRGQLERPHEKNCECSWARVRLVKKHGDGPPASVKQLEFLRRLGTSPDPDLTMKAASRNIKRILKRKAKR